MEKLTIKDLAIRIENYLYDFDPYEYADAFDSRGEGLDRIAEILSCPEGCEVLFNQLQDCGEMGSFKEMHEADALCKDIKQFEAENFIKKEEEVEL